MRYNIIDIGSNTVKMTLFDVSICSGNGIPCFKSIFMKKVPAGLLNYIKDNVFTEDGITKLSYILDDFVKASNDYGCEKTLCFSTAVLRKASNSDFVTERIYNSTGIEVDVVKGTDEAFYSFMGLCYSLNIRQVYETEKEVRSENRIASIAFDADSSKSDSGTMLDLGGGSTEILYFENMQIKSAVSLPFGCLYLYNRFVSGVLPTAEEAHDISDFILSEIVSKSENLPDVTNTRGFPIYLIGGTAHAMATLYCNMSGQKYKYKKYTAESNLTEKILNYYPVGEPKTEELISKLLPDRINTVFPGLYAYDTLIKHFHPESVCIADAGIREGYLYAYLKGMQKKKV